MLSAFPILRNQAVQAFQQQNFSMLFISANDKPIKKTKNKKHQHAKTELT